MERWIRYRHNAIKVNSFSAFANIKGGYNQTYRDVYFVRVLGTDDTLPNEILKLDEQLDSRMMEGTLFYKRIQKLPNLSSVEEANDYALFYSKWIEGNREGVETRFLKRGQVLSKILSSAIKEVVDKYCAHKKNKTDSMIKNFIVKLLFWYDFVMEDFDLQWDERVCIKIVAENILKEQEYLFFYMLTLIGADVLLIQNKADIEVQADIKELSTEFILGTFGDCNIPTYRKKEKNIQVEQNQRKREREWKQQEHQGEVGQRGIEQQEMIKVRLPERRREGLNIPKGDTRNKQSEVKKVSNIYEQSKTTDRKRKERTEKSFEELALLASSVVMIAVHNKAGDVIATGSGIMMSQNGYILTNHHVITDGYFYSIRIEEDEKMYQTDEVVKYHSVLDLAILRIDRKLNPIPIYKGSQKLVRGQKVVAIGSPLGLFNSVSDGIISGFRNIDGVDMIQFTAPTSHGSSGGAVLNMYGEVIGISTAGIDKGQNINLAVGYEGINLFVRGFEDL